MKIDGRDASPVFHKRRQVQGLSPCTRAEIEDPFAGLRSDETGDDLRGFVLNPDEPLFVRGRLTKTSGRGAKEDAVAGEGRRFGGGAVLGECCKRLFA